MTTGRDGRNKSQLCLKVDDDREINHHGVARDVSNEDKGGSDDGHGGKIQVAPISRLPSATK